MLDTAERQAAVAEWKRLAAEPGPPSRTGVGCMTMLLALCVSLGGPLVLRWLGVELPRLLKIAAAVILALLFFGGAAFALFLGSGRFSRDSWRAEEAIRWFEAHGAEGDPVTRRNMVVSLLYHAYSSDGPSTSTTFNFEQARSRLGAALPYVMEVERALAVDLRIYRVFTDDKVRLPG